MLYCDNCKRVTPTNTSVLETTKDTEDDQTLDNTEIVVYYHCALCGTEQDSFLTARA